ncbi:MAG: hypothetical protein ACXVW1_05980 [Nocardioides sp.]
MPLTRRTRRWTAAATALLALTLLPVLVGGGPAHAADPCLTEQQQPSDPGGTGVTTSVCDDITPPETTLDSTSPAVNSGGWVRETSVSFTFSGHYTDADTGALAYQCQLGTSSIPADASWTSCTSPATYDHLNQATQQALDYHFFVRAVDSDDQAIDATAPVGCAPLVCTPASSDKPDYDASPAGIAFRVDSIPPVTHTYLTSPVFLAPDDDADQPMLLATSAQVRLDSQSDEAHPNKYACTLDGRAVACRDGITTLTGLTPGRHSFVAGATDPAGNQGPDAPALPFYVPRNLTGSTPWHRVRESGYFAGDYLETSKVGATLSAPGRNVRVLRLIAPAGPNLGKVQVKVARSAWFTVNLHAKTYERLHVYQVRDQYAPLVSGKILVRVKSLPPHGVVRVDGVFTRSR